jgi:hypothetical protein
MPARVSIGMPLYNAERHLAEALDSLLAQDYEDIELVISDNASSDGTEAICRAYAARDKRITYQRAEVNHGAVWNFNRVFELSRGDYFMWAAYDDTRAPTFVSACLSALDAHPEAVICCTKVGFIDQDSRPVEAWFELVPPVGQTYRSRVSAIARARFWLDFYGLIRRGALARTRLAQPVWGFDVAVGLELCMLGRLLLLPETLFYYRVNRRETTELVAGTLGSSEPTGVVPVNWSAMTLELSRSIWHAPLGRVRKAALATQLVIQLCVFNGLVGSGIRKDVRSNLAAAWADHRFGRVAALISMAALVLPVQNGLVRGAYRHVRPPKPTSETPV